MAYQEDLNKSTSVFDVASGFSDVILVVEDKELHVNRTLLSQASPVFERMFNGEFKEKESHKITLPGKSYKDMKEMLSVIYPSVMKDVTRQNVDGLLALAEEYQLTALTERCERILVTLCEKSSATDIVHFMLLAGRFDLPTLLERSTDVAAEKSFKGHDYGTVYDGFDIPMKMICGLYGIDEFKNLSLETQNLYLQKRVYLLEKTHKISGYNA